MNIRKYYTRKITVSKKFPTKVLDGIKSIYAGYENYTLAITSDGSLYKWGAEDFGQMLYTYNKIEPLPVKVMDNVAAVSGAQGGFRLMALKTDGSLCTWGLDQYPSYDVTITPVIRMNGVLLPIENVFIVESDITVTEPEDESEKAGWRTASGTYRHG